jgi:hypothetical protein
VYSPGSRHSFITSEEMIQVVRSYEMDSMTRSSSVIDLFQNPIRFPLFNPISRRSNRLPPPTYNRVVYSIRLWYESMTLAT